jgi:hypothetical protein
MAFLCYDVVITIKERPRRSVEESRPAKAIILFVVSHSLETELSLLC